MAPWLQRKIAFLFGLEIVCLASKTKYTKTFIKINYAR